MVVIIAAASCGFLGWRALSQGNMLAAAVSAGCTLFLAACIPLGCVTLTRPTSLVLTDAGFYMTGVGEIPLVPWSAVDEFVLLKRPYYAGHLVALRMYAVGFRLKPGLSIDTGWKSHFHAPDVDGEIAMNLTTTVKETYRILEHWRRERSSNRGAAPHLMSRAGSI